MQKTSYYYCRHSEADEESRCHKMRLNAAELEQAVFLTLKKQMEAAAPLAPDGTLRVDASVPERAEYEQQIETLQDGKAALGQMVQEGRFRGGSAPYGYDLVPSGTYNKRKHEVFKLEINPDEAMCSADTAAGV